MIYILWVRNPIKESIWSNPDDKTTQPTFLFIPCTVREESKVWTRNETQFQVTELTVKKKKKRYGLASTNFFRAFWKKRTLRREEGRKCATSTTRSRCVAAGPNRTEGHRIAFKRVGCFFRFRLQRFFFLTGLNFDICFIFFSFNQTERSFFIRGEAFTPSWFFTSSKATPTK